MATQGGGKKLPAKTSVPSGDYYIPPVPVAVAPSSSVGGGRHSGLQLLLVS
jgi:hypothetical protein